MNKNTDVFEHYKVGKALRIMAIPTIMSQLIVLIYNLADTFYIGQTNNPAMVAGASLILPVFNIALSISGLAGVGGGSLISRLLGENKADHAKRVSNFSILLGASLAFIFSLGTFLFMNPLIHALGASSDTYIYARQYAFFVVVLGAIPTVLSNTLANLVRSIGESRKAGFGIMLGGILNMIIDPLFMFVIFPDGMEMAGAGFATFLSNVVACSYFVIQVNKMKESPIRFQYSGLPERKEILSIFNVGIPSCIATLLFDLDYVVLDKLMSTYGDVALAAIGIVLKAERLPLNVGIGICQGMVPLTAYNYAAGNYKRMKDILKCALLAGIVCALLSIGMYEIFAKDILHLFIKDGSTIELGTYFLQARAVATVLMFMSFFFVHTFNSFGKGEYALFLGVMRWAVFNIPMLYIMNWLVGMYGLVWSQLLADILTVSLSFFVFIRFMKKNQYM